MPPSLPPAAAAVDEARLWNRLMTMAEIGATPRGGVNRPALSPDDARARRLLADWAAELGFSVAIDEVANLYVRRPGSDPAAAPVMTGSHLDSQPTGGKFDGPYGVLAGFEVLEAVARAGIETRRPLEVVAWTNEEGSRYQPSCMGSRLFSGAQPLAEMLPARDRDGVTVEQALAETLAALPDIPRIAAGGPAATYVEPHIEQGPILEQAGTTVGIVTGIQGARYFGVEVTGEEAHAGTTPLRRRKDALKAAVAMVTALEALFHDETDTVRFTVGRFEIQPGSPNTVPGQVYFSVDVRHPEEATIARLTDQVEDVCRANARGCAVRVFETSRRAPSVFDPGVIDALRDQAAALGLSHMDIASGAGHDANYLTRVCPTGMIFVPCKGGVSHNETESATPADLAAGTRLLAAFMAEQANA